MLLAHQVNGSPAQSPPVHYYSASFSPDSRWIIFESNSEGETAIYKVALNGKQLVKLHQPGIQPRWSPDGKNIVFSEGGRLCLIRSDGSGKRFLTDASLGAHFVPIFSPDGMWIAFGAQDHARKNLYRIGTIKSNGESMRMVTDDSWSSYGPRWTPDGKRILFTQEALLARDVDETPRDFIGRVKRTRATVSIAPDGKSPRIEWALPIQEDEQANECSPDGRWTVVAKQANGYAGVFITDRTTGREQMVVGTPVKQAPSVSSRIRPPVRHANRP